MDELPARDALKLYDVMQQKYKINVYTLQVIYLYYAISGARYPSVTDHFAQYLKVHEEYEPADARYLQNHKGHLMYVRPEETHITPELVKATSLSGTREELIERLRSMKDAGYSQVTVQLVHGHEAALEEWAEVFAAV